MDSFHHRFVASGHGRCIKAKLFIGLGNRHFTAKLARRINRVDHFHQGDGLVEWHGGHHLRLQAPRPGRIGGVVEHVSYGAPHLVGGDRRQGQPAPDAGGFAQNGQFFEFDGKLLDPAPAPANAAGNVYEGRMMLLPTGQVLFAAGSAAMAATQSPTTIRPDPAA